jgi:hypothetical protein
MMKRMISAVLVSLLASGAVLAQGTPVQGTPAQGTDTTKVKTEAAPVAGVAGKTKVKADKKGKKVKVKQEAAATPAQ